MIFPLRPSYPLDSHHCLDEVYQRQEAEDGSSLLYLRRYASLSWQRWANDPNRDWDSNRDLNTFGNSIWGIWNILIRFAILFEDFAILFENFAILFDQ